MDPDRRGGVEELGKVEEGENVNRKKIYRLRRESIFNKRVRMKHPEYY